MKPIHYPFDTPPAEGEAIEVASGILWMRLPLPMALNHVNVYALREDDGWTIIDTGFNTKRTQAIWQTLMDGPLEGKPIKRVFLTHHHPDHVGLAGWFKSVHGAELWSSRLTWFYTRMMVLDHQEVWPQETLDFYRSAGMDKDVFEARSQDKPFNYSTTVHPIPLGFRSVKQGDVVTIGNRTWDIHIGNGHSPQHLTFWCHEEPLVIAGDQILPSISPNLGVYPTEPEADTVSEWLESCQRFSDLANEDHFVLPGHKLPFTGLPARLTQLIDNHHGCLKRLLEFLDTPKSAGECFMPLFKREIKGGEYGLALVESVGHLNHLHQSGQVSRIMHNGVWLYQRIDH